MSWHEVTAAMLQQLLAKFRPKPASIPAGDGRPKAADPGASLHLIYGEILRLAAQIESHAEQAPYPHIVSQLRRIAGEKRDIARVLRERVSGFGGEEESTDVAVRTGRNHWERMSQDLRDHRALEDNLVRAAEYFADRAPEKSRALRDATAAQSHHKDQFLDLIAKADPQAHQF